MQKPLSFNRTYNKKAGPCRLCSRLWMYIHHKKAGLQSCCSANRGSGIAFLSKQQHRSPRRTYYIF